MLNNSGTFAIVKIGGRQYKVRKNLKIQVDKMTCAVGQIVQLKDVLLLSDENSTNVIVGSPTVKNASVTAEVLGQKRLEKIIILKKRRRKNSRRTGGFVPTVTELKITNVGFGN